MPESCILPNGFEACVYCWHVFGAEDEHTPPVGIGGGINYTYGPVVQAVTGEEFEAVCDSVGGTPLAHPDCYREWAAATNDTDRQLMEFSNG